MMTSESTNQTREIFGLPFLLHNKAVAERRPQRLGRKNLRLERFINVCKAFIRCRLCLNRQFAKKEKMQSVSGETSLDSELLKEKTRPLETALCSLQGGSEEPL